MNGHVHGVAGPHDCEGGRVRKSLQVGVDRTAIRWHIAKTRRAVVVGGGDPRGVRRPCTCQREPYARRVKRLAASVDQRDRAATAPCEPAPVPMGSAATTVAVRTAGRASSNAYVVMRFAELVCERRISAVVEAAVANLGGNGGCLPLERLAATPVKTHEPIGSEPAAAEVRRLWSKARDD
jgi:hypothetical protein